MELKPNEHSSLKMVEGYSNCTNMELKQILPFTETQGTSTNSNCTNMELKPDCAG